MNKEELALRLNNRPYGNEITEEEELLAKENNLVVIFCYSDDLVEFRGKIYDELDAYEGTDFIIATPGMEYQDEEGRIYTAKDLEVLPFDDDSPSQVNRFSAQWSPEELDCSWLIKTAVPHITFDIIEDQELYCRGIVVDTQDLQ